MAYQSSKSMCVIRCVCVCVCVCLTTQFVEDLKQRIAHPAMALSKSFPSQGDLQRMAGATGGPTPFNKASVGPGTGISAMALSVQLPFELRVLEVSTCVCVCVCVAQLCV